MMTARRAKRRVAPNAEDHMRPVGIALGLAAAFALGASAPPAQAEDDLAIVKSCAEVLVGGLRLIAEDRVDRFQGKVPEATARCRGGEKAVSGRNTPWVDW